MTPEEKYIQERAEAAFPTAVVSIVLSTVFLEGQKGYITGYTEALSEMEGFGEWLFDNVGKWPKDKNKNYSYNPDPGEAGWKMPELLALYRKENKEG